MGKRRVSINDLPEWYRDQVADTFANLERLTRSRSVETKKDPRYDTPCSIHIHSVRHKLADPDGVSGKACIDGLVHCKILADDSAKYVKSVSYSQEQGQNEETIITITPEVNHV